MLSPPPDHAIWHFRKPAHQERWRTLAGGRDPFGLLHDRAAWRPPTRLNIPAVTLDGETTSSRHSVHRRACPHCRLLIGCARPTRQRAPKQHSMVWCRLHPGVKILRNISSFGYERPVHVEMTFETCGCRVNFRLGRRRVRIAQAARPGRSPTHARRAPNGPSNCCPTGPSAAFGKTLAEQGGAAMGGATRINIDQPLPTPSTRLAD